jgi:hypothetical protein
MKENEGPQENPGLTYSLQITTFLHCPRCMRERPKDASPQDWARISVGYTRWGIQLWCNRHNCNIMNMDFEGHKHPAMIGVGVIEIE